MPDVWFVPRPGTARLLARHPMILRALYPWAREVQRRAIARAPEDTGRLKSRIRIVSTVDALRVITDATNPKDGFRYSVLQERRRPYLRPAIRR